MVIRYIYAVFLALDCLASALSFGAPAATISGRLGAAREANVPVASAFCRALDWFVFHVFGQAHHCETALAHYKLREAVAPQ
jgi:hypothetical protein